MKLTRLLLLILVGFAALLLTLDFAASPHFAQTQSNITVQMDKPGAAISPSMFGIFFEDINFAADGGIYPERIKNRAFEFDDKLMGWKKIEPTKGSITIAAQEPLNATTPHYLHIKADSAGIGVSNEGFRGMGVQQGASYTFSVFARRGEGAPALRIELVTAQGQRLGQAKLSGFSPQWKKHAVTLRATATEAKAQLNVIVEGRGTLDLDMVSLYPQDTWKKRPNGLRADLVQLLAELKPGFVRFPGGCIVEGRVLDERYQWKTTIGDMTDRKLIINRWNMEFRKRDPNRAPEDYFQSFGLGFYEYFQLCEDIGAEPLPIINCGMACQFNSNELVALDQLDPYLQDALDLIEFANGSIVTPWGRKRAEMGHPKPFNLKMIGIGNEQWGPQYIERYEPFAKAIKAKYPDIKLISSVGPSASGEQFDFLWSKLRALKADIVDEHYYMKPEWFLRNAHRYDNYDRNGPRVFAGEFAAQSVAVVSKDNRNNWECALAEAAFMTGLERNADVVELASYAPLLAHVDAWQWTPNLIWFDNLRSFGTPNYYVQKLFANHRGTNILPVQLDGNPTDLFASASYDKPAGELILKVVNAAATTKDVSVNLAGAGKTGARGKVFVLASADLKVENTLNEPKKIAPIEQALPIAGSRINYKVAAQSLTVLRVPCAVR
ncbi:MAG TPA: alpha-L-arabinofuranosidase C-terminal domain-containing protein [Blastocatellia bacterium]|nr:alpha-L-arabinofuranosidase C-terminal domain-containing protein [Blastocatellia bacterium]